MIRPHSDRIAVGVIGVGSMGEHHARILSELPAADLVGVTDADFDRAEAVANRYGTRALSMDTLLERCSAVTVAVPTRAHEEVVTSCLEADTHVLVEKPIAHSVEAARRLAETANRAGLVLQVGHVERFNPAVRTARDVLEDLTPIAVDAQRLGPPIDRQGDRSVTTDLMIHDVDLVHWLLGTPPTVMSAAAGADGAYATATLRNGPVIATLTASRVTQQKVRRLAITTEDCLVVVDYLEQSVTIHRDSYPEYVRDDGGTRYRHEHVLERPQVDSGEPLRLELEAFLESVHTGARPQVTPSEAIAALETVQSIERHLVDRLEVSP